MYIRGQSNDDHVTNFSFPLDRFATEISKHYLIESLDRLPMSRRDVTAEINHRSFLCLAGHRLRFKRFAFLYDSRYLAWRRECTDFDTVQVAVSLGRDGFMAYSGNARIITRPYAPTRQTSLGQPLSRPYIETQAYYGSPSWRSTGGNNFLNHLCDGMSLRVEKRCGFKV